MHDVKKGHPYRSKDYRCFIGYRKSFHEGRPAQEAVEAEMYSVVSLLALRVSCETVHNKKMFED